MNPSSEQLHAAHAGPDGAFLIAAGPGTGKTFTMVERFAWLVQERRLAAESILAVTFSEAAAGELRERLAERLGRSLDDAWIGTFHGICLRLLREHAYLVGIPRELRVLDETGQRLLVGRLQALFRSGAEPGLDRDFEALNPDDVADLIRNGPAFALKLKGRGIAPDEFRARALELHAVHSSAPPDAAALAEAEAIFVLHTIYAAYEARLKAAGGMDFDDLILRANAALREVPGFRARCQERFRSILVDEFQDTNRIQLELIRLLAAEGFGNVTAVGDAKQSIYGWRDAEIENIRSRFPGERRPLTINRRSVQEILDLATAFIRRDPDFADEPGLVAARGAGEQPVAVVMAADARGEARLVAAEIRRLVAAGRRYPEIAILSHSVKLLPREFEDELRAQGIPYLTTGGVGFFDREEVKDVLALLRLTADPMDDGALVRVLQGPVLRIGDARLYALAIRRLGRRGMRLRDCLDESRQAGWPELEAGAARKLERLLGVTDELGRTRDGLTVADILNRLLEATGYLRYARLRAAAEGSRPLLNLRKVFRMAERFEQDSVLAGLQDFVAHLDQLTEAAIPIAAAEVADLPAVRLLTVHGAKGLEFPIVFVVNVRRPNPRDSEKLFFDPDGTGFLMKFWRSDRHPRFRRHMPGDEAVALARRERRRGVYVALTRAAERLYVSASRPELGPEDVGEETDDHFAEILRWALDHPDAARVIQAEQLELAPVTSPPMPAPARPKADPVRVAARLERLAAAGRRGEPPAVREVRLSFSQLHLYQVCPVRYRFQEVWRVPASPDELLSRPAAGSGAAELGAQVHRALAAHHTIGGDLAGLYAGPEAGLEMLRAYLGHPLASAPTLGTEVEFNLRLGGVRLRGVVDRICAVGGEPVVIDYKTNSRLDDRLLAAYSTQLRLYGLAAEQGLLPGVLSPPQLVLFDLRQGRALEVAGDAAGARAAVEAAAHRIANSDFALGPEHADRPCFLCAYRPLCPDARR